MNDVQKLIGKYKQIRGINFLKETYKAKYGLVGIGNHTINNLLPIIQYLQLPLKWIGCTSEDKAALIEEKYHVKGTSSIKDIMEDDEVKGLFVSATPQTHFKLAKEVIKSGKALFIEKPPCNTIEELRELKEMERACGSNIVVVGLQKRYSPMTKLLKKQLKSKKLISYNLRYLTGLYPEGEAVMDLFIHPLDYVCHLFGKADIVSIKHIKSAKKGGETLLLVLQHQNIVGTLELSTCYTWHSSKEMIEVNTDDSVVALEQMESLTVAKKQSSIMGIPLEKVMPKQMNSYLHFERNNFTPIVANNQLYQQGYMGEIEAFANMVEGKKNGENLSQFEQIEATYELITEIRKNINQK